MDFWQLCGLVLFVLQLISRVFFLNHQSWFLGEMREPKNSLWFLSLLLCSWWTSEASPAVWKSCSAPAAAAAPASPSSSSSQPHSVSAHAQGTAVLLCRSRIPYVSWHPSRKSVFKGKKAFSTCLGLLSSSTRSGPHLPPDLTPWLMLNSVCLAKPSRLSRLWLWRRRDTCLL